MELLTNIGIAILCALASAVFLVIMWFVVGMLICFYKIYIKKQKPKSEEFDKYLN